MAREPAAVRTRICEVLRQRLLPQDGGGTLHLVVYGLARCARFASVGQVPEFDGDRAFFEVEPKRGTKLGYVFLRQVEPPSRSLTWHD